MYKAIPWELFIGIFYILSKYNKNDKLDAVETKRDST